METEFDAILTEPAAKQVTDESTILMEIDEEIATAQAEGNTAVVKKLTALKARVEAALKVAKGESLPQTDEQSGSLTALLGLVMAGSLTLGGLGMRRRKHQN